jgi:hypothetical protein
MPSQVITNVRLIVDGRDLSGQLNAVAIEYGADALESTTFGSGTRTHQGGLKTTAMSHQGYWAAADDAHVFARVGPQATVTVGPDGTASGALAYFEQMMHSTYEPGPGAVGELIPFSFSAEAAGPLVRGLVLAPPVAVTAGGDGTAYQLGGVLAGQRIYAALHVLAISAGETLTVKVQSDNASGFPSPIDQITFTGATATGAQFLSTAGAITDDYWRANWTLTGGSATFLLSAGIL